MNPRIAIKHPCHWPQSPCRDRDNPLPILRITELQRLTPVQQNLGPSLVFRRSDTRHATPMIAKPRLPESNRCLLLDWLSLDST